jgi:hypothetical protein
MTSEEFFSGERAYDIWPQNAVCDLADSGSDSRHKLT